MKTLTIILTIVLVVFMTGCAGFQVTEKRAGYRDLNRPSTPSETGLLYGLIGAGIGAGMGSMLNTGIDEKWQNYGTATYSSRYNHKNSGGNNYRGGRNIRSGHNNVSRHTTKSRRGNNIFSAILQGFFTFQQIGYNIGVEQRTQRPQEENARLRQ